MKTIIQILVFGFSFVIILALCEIFIRSARIENVSSTELYDDIGRGRRKNLEYLYFNEGFGVGKFNEYRYIGEANPPKRKKNTIRVVLLGDSYVESFQVFERHYFGNIAENILKKDHPSKDFEFLNFGRSGFDIENIYVYHKTFADKFNPDFFLYFISNGDLIPSSVDPLLPKTIIKNDSLIISFDFDKSQIDVFEKTKFFTQNFSIIHMLNNGRRKINEIPVESILLDKIYTWFVSTSEENKNPENFKYIFHPITQKILQNLNPKKVIFVNKSDIKLSNEFKEFCTERGFILFDLSELLNSMKQSGIDPNKWKVTGKEGHWNQKAHRNIGNFIAKNIQELIEKD